MEQGKIISGTPKPDSGKDAKSEGMGKKVEQPLLDNKLRDLAKSEMVQLMKIKLINQSKIAGIKATEKKRKDDAHALMEKIRGGKLERI